MATDEEIQALLPDDAPDAPELDDQILRDLESKYAGTLCPVHGVPPSFDMDEKGSLIERFCCEALAQIFRELQASDPGDEAPLPPEATP